MGLFRKKNFTEKELQEINLFDSFIAMIREKRRENGYFNSPILDIAYYVFFSRLVTEISLIPKEEKASLDLTYARHLAQGKKIGVGDILTVIREFNGIYDSTKRNREAEGHFLPFYLGLV